MRLDKRIKVTLILVLCSFLLIGCSLYNNYEREDDFIDDIPTNELDELEDVWLETEYETYQVGTISVRVKWYNTLSDSMMFGQYFTLEEKVNDDWKMVNKETKTNYGFTDEGIILNANDTRWHTYDLIPYTDGLAAGEYRISATFHRETLDGKAYEGNTPQYQIYGYFNVSDHEIKRNMTVMDDSKIEYLSEEYHFGIYLPKEWDGLQVITEKETGDKEWDDLFSKIDKEYRVIHLRHPQWTKDAPYQDISLVLFRREQWNNNLDDATNGDFDILPQILSGGSRYYVLLQHPTAYNNTLKGYNEVLDIIGTEYRNSSIHDY